MKGMDMETVLIKKLQATKEKLVADNRNAKRLIAENQKAIAVITSLLKIRHYQKEA